MDRNSLFWKKLMHAAIIVALVAAQSMALAHQVSHWDEHTDESCHVCSMSTHFDDLAISNGHELAIRPSEAVTDGVPAPDHFLSNQHSPYSERAPPVSL